MTMTDGKRRLIVNADDLGLSTDIDAAIEELHRAGRVTNASLMVDGDCLDDALGVIRRNPKLAVGLHLDLAPVLGLYEMPYERMRERARTAEMQDKVAAEVDRQINLFKGLGLDFTHMDSHRHFHALPELFQTVIGVAAEHGLRTVRLAKTWLLPRTPSVFWDEAFHRDAMRLLDSLGIGYADSFLHGWMPYTEADFQPGWTELMAHVAQGRAEHLPEYTLLRSPEFERRVQSSGALLRSYRDLAARQGSRA